MKLYAATGACGLHVQIVLREAGLAFDCELVDLATKRTASGADFNPINSKGYIPVLVLNDGAVLTEGAVINQWIADQVITSKPELFAPAGSMARVRIQEWLHFIGTEIHKTFHPLFAPSDEASKAAARADIARRYAYVEEALAQHEFLTGSAFTIADAYLFNVVSWSKLAGVSLDNLPKLRAFMTRVGARPSVRESQVAEGLIKLAQAT